MSGEGKIRFSVHVIIMYQSRGLLTGVSLLTIAGGTEQLGQSLLMVERGFSAVGAFRG